MVLILLPRKSEKFYVVYEQSINSCSQKKIEENSTNQSFLICNESTFINFIYNPNKIIKSMELSRINDFEITSKNNFIEKFSDPLSFRVKNNFDLLNREKKFEFNLIIKDTVLNSIKIIPVLKYDDLCLTESLN